MTFVPDKQTLSEKYDYVIWLGDFNYRINKERSVVEAMIKDEAFEVGSIFFWDF